jgi:TP901 family phage tail tape measure protein
MAFDLVARLRLVDKMTSPMRSITGQLAALGAAVGGVTIAMSSLNKAMKFEAQLSTIKALTGATAQEMDQMRSLALKMGQNTKYSALEAAQGIEELLKAGLTPAAVQTGALEAALNLATAGSLELAGAAEIMSTALNAFKKDAMTAAEASNILAGTANASATSVGELRHGLAMVSAVAAGIGMSFKETNTALGLFANNGLKGSDAGTSLKSMLLNLSPSTKSATKLFKQLGVITEKGNNLFYDAKGELKDLTEIADILRKSFGKLTSQQRQDAFKEMFGTDAIRAANILYEEGADGVLKFYDEISKVTALDVAKEKMNNAAGAMEQFQGAIETLQISALTPMLPIVKDLALLFADLAERYTPAITRSFEKLSAKLREYIDPYVNDLSNVKATTEMEFKFLQSEKMFHNQKAPKITTTLQIIFDDIITSFNKWFYENGGDAKIATIGVEIGKVIGTAILRGLDLTIPSIIGWLNKKLESGMSYIPLTPQYFGYEGYDTPFYQSKASGIGYVPYDGFAAKLHKGERVLTREENRQYNGSKGGNTFNISISNMNVRNDDDIDKVARALARELDMADGLLP